MDTQTLSTSLKELVPGELDWKLALYSTKKSKDGLELDFSLCKMQNIGGWIETVVETLLQKTLATRTVAPYTPFLPKESIGALAADDPAMRDRLYDILHGIEGALEYAPEDFLSGVLPKTAGYAFLGTREGENGTVRVLLMRRGNPFLSAQRTRLCVSKANEIVQSETPLARFTPAIDFVLIDGTGYFISPSIEKDFALENRIFAVCAKRLALVADASAVSDYEQLEKAAMSAKNARKFLDFDPELLEYIARLSVTDRMDFLGTYGITTDPAGKMDTADPDQCELIIDLLCRRSCLDALGRLSVGSNITPR